MADKITRFPRLYEAQGADVFTDRDGCVCGPCRRRRRRSDRATADVIAKRLTVICIAFAVGFGILYALGDTLRGVW